MALVLSIAVADLKRLVGIAAGDTSQDTALGATLAAEQAVWEYGLDPAVLAASVGDAGPAGGAGAGGSGAAGGELFRAAHPVAGVHG